MCKELFFYGAEFINYWSLIFWGIKLFLDNKEIGTKPKYRHCNVVVVVLSIPIAVVSSINHRYVIYSTVVTYFIILSMLLILKIVTNGFSIKCFPLIVAYVFCMKLLDLWVVTIVVEVNKISRYVKLDLINMGRDRVVFCIFMCICYYYSNYICFQKINIIKYLMENRYYKLLICIYSYLGNLCFCTVYRFDYRDKLIGYWILYLVCAFIFFGTFIIYSMKIKSQQKEYFLYIRSNMMESNYLQLKKVYEENQTLQHDYKNHLLAVSELIKEKKNDEATDYIYRYIDYANKSLIVVKTGNDIIDIIVNSKISEAKEKNIWFTYEIDCLNRKLIEDIDMCALLANLLDNAIEGCEKIEEEKKWIHLKIIIKKDMLIIQLMNSIHKDMILKKQIFNSEKQNPQLHGWGMKSIERVVKKYNGTKQYYINKYQIEIFITIPI